MLSTGTNVEKMRSPLVRWPALGLLLGSVQLFVAMAVEQSLRPGYSDFGNTISDLGVGPYSWIFNTSVILLGVFGFLGVLFLSQVFPRRRLAWVAEGFLLVGTLGAVAVGLFPEPSTALWGQAHDAASVITFLDANLGLFLMGLAMFRDGTWGKYASLTTFLGAFSTIALAFYISNFLSHGNYLGLGEGGLERVVAFPVLIWAIVVGVIILSFRDVSSAVHPPPAPEPA